jgi:hypothetical protein
MRARAPHTHQHSDVRAQAQREVGPTTPKQITIYMHHLFQVRELLLLLLLARDPEGIFASNALRIVAWRCVRACVRVSGARVLSFAGHCPQRREA